jgi:hypothetical protein
MSNLQSETTQNNQHQNSFHHQVHHDPIPPPIDSELSPSSSSVLHSSKDEDSISLLLLQLEAPLTNPSQASALTTLKRSPANPSRRHASKQQHREVIQLTKSTRLYHVGERFMRLATEDQPCALKLYFKVHDISQDRRSVSTQPLSSNANNLRMNTVFCFLGLQLVRQIDLIARKY